MLRKVSPEEDKRILDEIERTAQNDPDQDIRAGVVKALGERGSAKASSLQEGRPVRCGGAK